MSENPKSASEPKELNWKAVSKMSELVTSLYISNKEQTAAAALAKQAQKQSSAQPNQNNDLSNEYENTNK
jgi:hypothetical protein